MSIVILGTAKKPPKVRHSVTPNSSTQSSFQVSQLNPRKGRVMAGRRRAAIRREIGRVGFETLENSLQLKFV